MKREYSANVTPANGGTVTVLVLAYDAIHAASILRKFGYRDIRNVVAI